MSKSTGVIPRAINAKIVATARQIADQMGYLTASISRRTDIINYLMSHQDVGKALESYIAKTKIRSHIKDNILRAYSQEQFVTYSMDDHVNWGRKKFNLAKLMLVGQDKGSPRRSVYWLKDEASGDSIIIGESAYKCWESALRSALLFIAKNKVSRSSNNVRIVLCLSPGTAQVTSAEEKFLSDVLRPIGVNIRIVRKALGAKESEYTFTPMQIEIREAAHISKSSFTAG